MGERKRSAIHGPYSGPVMGLLSPKMRVFVTLVLLIVWLVWSFYP